MTEFLARIFPGFLICLLVGAAAYGVEFVEEAGLGKAWLGAPVLALIIGAACRIAWQPAPTLMSGIRFSTKYPLEVAIVLLGAALSAQAMAAVGPGLLAAIIVVVLLSIVATYGVGRLLGLTWRTATLIACGNSICGNSAILAVAPVIGAKSHELATGITFTALISVPVVIGLPLLVPLFQTSDIQYGVLAGLTVYAIPQVLAATAPLGALAIDTGTIVKLVRVVMLGPLCVALALMTARRRASEGMSGLSPKLIPWFIFGFLAMAAARSTGLIPPSLIPVLAKLSAALTVISLAALGLGLDIRAALRTGPRVMVAVLLSVTMLLVMGLTVIAVVDLT